jgi:hypothetical protein
MRRQAVGVLGLGILLVAGLTSCGDPAKQAPQGTVATRQAPPGKELEANTFTYRGRGIVREINREGLTITIEHQGIPGFMPVPSVLSFMVANAELLQDVEVLQHNPAETKIIELTEAVVTPSTTPPTSP